MLDLLEEFKSNVSQALIRKASIQCSRWAENYVNLGKPKPGRMNFEGHPWEREMMDCESNWTGRKAAQMGYTNVALCRAIHANDIKKVDVLYLLPKRSPDAADFSKSKFDAILELSPHLSSLYSSTRNIGHKQAVGGVNLFIRGARSRSGLKLISVGMQIWDELDEMPQKQLALATERSSGYEEADTQRMRISTPSIPDFGIDAAIKLTDDSRFVFKCPRCTRWTEIAFPESLVITTDNLGDEIGLRKSHIICPLCKGILHHEEKKDFLALSNDDTIEGPHWRPTKFGFSERGFCINQLYSTVIPAWKVAETRLKGEVEPSEMREFWNSKGGLPYIEEGARVNAKDLAACKGSYSKEATPPTGQLITMGVDVGKVLHCWVDQWLLPEVIGRDLNMFARARNLWHGTIKDFDELARIQVYYQVVQSVIDWQPEERKSKEFCERFFGHAMRCYFHRGARGKAMYKNDEDLIVGVSRTSWLDLSQSRFKAPSPSITIPGDSLQTALDQIMALVRVEKKDADGNPVAKYMSTATDHFAFARLYSEIALPLGVSAGKSHDLNSLL